MAKHQRRGAVRHGIRGCVLGANESRVIGIRPQIGYLFPVGDMQGYLNLKAYGEFDADRRPSGWLTFVISPTAERASTKSMMVHSDGLTA
jgi:hypothetical protein